MANGPEKASDDEAQHLLDLRRTHMPGETEQIVEVVLVHDQAGLERRPVAQHAHGRGRALRDRRRRQQRRAVHRLPGLDRTARSRQHRRSRRHSPALRTHPRCPRAARSSRACERLDEEGGTLAQPSLERRGRHFVEHGHELALPRGFGSGRRCLVPGSVGPAPVHGTRSQRDVAVLALGGRLALGEVHLERANQVRAAFGAARSRRRRSRARPRSTGWRTAPV